MIPDKEEDIKPRFHKSKTHSQKHTDEAADDDSDSEDGGDDENSLSDWNLSECDPEYFFEREKTRLPF